MGRGPLRLRGQLMQAVILAAGRGLGLEPPPNHLPKCLVPIGDHPLLYHQIRALKKWGVNKICVVVGSYKEKVEKFLQNEVDVKIVENPEYQTANVLASFAHALQVIDRTDAFIILAGDVIFEDSIIEGLIDGEGDLTLCVVQKRCGDEEVKVIVDQGRIVELGKKLDPEICYGEFLGIFKATRKIMRDIEDIVNQMMNSGEVQSYLFDMINRLIRDKKRTVKAFDIKEAFWEDIDFPEDVQRIWSTLKNIR